MSIERARRAESNGNKISLFWWFWTKLRGTEICWNSCFCASRGSRSEFQGWKSEKGIGLCYWCRTQRPLAPHEAHAAKPSRNSGFCTRLLWPFWAHLSQLRLENTGWFWCLSMQLGELFRMIYKLSIYKIHPAKFRGG